MKLPLVYYDNNLLRKVCDSVASVTADIVDLASSMIETMDANNGIGIAAPQVGRSIQMFVLRRYVGLDRGDVELSSPRVYINPKVLFMSKKMSVAEEGCLSIPGLTLPVKRSTRIRVEFMDLKGRCKTEEISGYNARVFLHEKDHLDGVLFIDRLDPAILESVKGDLVEIDKHYNL